MEGGTAPGQGAEQGRQLRVRVTWAESPVRRHSGPLWHLLSGKRWGLLSDVARGRHTMGAASGETRRRHMEGGGGAPRSWSCRGHGGGPDSGLELSLRQTPAREAGPLAGGRPGGPMRPGALREGSALMESGSTQSSGAWTSHSESLGTRQAGSLGCLAGTDLVETLSSWPGWSLSLK